MFICHYGILALCKLKYKLAGVKPTPINDQPPKIPKKLPNSAITLYLSLAKILVVL